MGRYDFDWGIKTLRNQGIDIPDCDSIDDYYTALEKMATIYANQPGKLQWIYEEMRMVKVKAHGENGTELAKLRFLCEVANRFLMNRPFFINFRNEPSREDLYERLNTIEVIPPGESHHNRCSKCHFLTDKKYRIIEDFMGGKENLMNNKVSFNLPPEMSEAMNSCTDVIGCILS